MNNFPLLSLMCSCLIMAFLLWTGGNLQFFSWCVCIFHTSCCLQSLFLNPLFSTRHTFLDGSMRKSKSNPITPNMLPSPHCLKFDASWSRQYSTFLNKQTPWKQAFIHSSKKKPYKTMSSRSDPRFTSFHTLITFLIANSFCAEYSLSNVSALCKVFRLIISYHILASSAQFLSLSSPNHLCCRSRFPYRIFQNMILVARSIFHILSSRFSTRSIWVINLGPTTVSFIMWHSVCFQALQ